MRRYRPPRKRRRESVRIPHRMSDQPDNLLRRIWRRARAGFSMPATEAQVADVNRRLARIERQLASVEKIWLRTRHLEPAVQSLLRERFLDTDTLPYPERLMARRFRLSSQNQEDGLTLALLNEVGATRRRFVEIGSGLSGGNSGFLARECGWSGLMVDGHVKHMVQVGRRFPTVTAVAAWVTRDNVNRAHHGQWFHWRSRPVQPRSGWQRLLDLGGDDGVLAADRDPGIQLDVRSGSIGHGPLRSEVRPAPPPHDVLRSVAGRAGEG